MADAWDAFPDAGRPAGKDAWDAFPDAGGSSFDRKAGIATQGTRVGILNTFGAPVDLLAAGMRAAGVPVNEPIGGSASLNKAADYVASIPSKLGLTDNKGARLQPQDATERAIHGAGEGVGSAIGTIIPAARLASVLPTGTVGQGVAQTLATGPRMQGAAAAAGGAAGGASENPYVGLATALAVPTAAGLGSRVVSPMPPARTAAEEERRRLVDVLRKNDVPLATGDITGNKGVQVLESVLETLPVSGGLQTAFRDRQREAVNRAVTATTGEGVPAFTTAERAARKAELGRKFEDLSTSTTVNLDREFTTKLDDILKNYREQLPPDVMKNVEQRLESLIGASTQPGNPQIPGAIYQKIRSKLSKQSTNAGDSEIRDALRETRNALDDAARRSLPEEVGREWDQVRRQYGNLKTIEGAMRNTDATVGDISPKALWQSVLNANKKGGSKDMTDLAAALSKVVGDKIGQSGTQPRSFWQNPVTGGGIGGAAYGATGSPTLAAGAVSLPPLAQILLENPITRSWAGNRALGSVPTLPSGETVGRLSLAQILSELANRGREQ